MAYIPYDSFIVNAPASQAEVVAALKGVVKDRNLLSVWSTDEGLVSYEGKVTAEGFKIVRMRTERNKVPYPVVSGRFSTSDYETCIGVKIRLPVVEIVFMVALVVVLAFAQFYTIENFGFTVFALGKWVMLISMYITTIYRFNQEVATVERFLHEVVDNLKATGNQIAEEQANSHC